MMREQCREKVGVGIGDVLEHRIFGGRRKGPGAWAWMAAEAASLAPPARPRLTTCAEAFVTLATRPAQTAPGS